MLRPICLYYYAFQYIKKSWIGVVLLITFQLSLSAQQPLTNEDIFILKYDFQRYVLYEALKNKWDILPGQDPRIILCPNNKHFDYFLPINILECFDNRESYLIKVSIDGWYLTNSIDTIFLNQERPFKFNHPSFYLQYSPTRDDKDKLIFYGPYLGVGVSISQQFPSHYESTRKIESLLSSYGVFRKKATVSSMELQYFHYNNIAVHYDDYFHYHKHLSPLFKNWLTETMQLDTSTVVFIVRNTILSPKPVLVLVPPIKSGVRPQAISDQTIYLVWFEAFTTLLPEMPMPEYKFSTDDPPPPPPSDPREKLLFHKVVFPIHLRPQRVKDFTPQWQLLSDEQIAKLSADASHNLNMFETVHIFCNYIVQQK